MIEIEKVAHSYLGPAKSGESRKSVKAIEALAPLSLQVGEGEFVCIVGPSGCGKSTLLRIIAGLLKPTQGKVLFNGKAIEGPQREIGLVFQQANLMPWRTVQENLTLPLELAGANPATRQQRAEEVLDMVQLTGFAHSYPAELSGGMAQRVAIGRALIQSPAVLLLDEPFGALDALTREQMALELLRIWSSERKTAIMVTHSITEAVFVADRVIVMSPRPGQIRAIIEVALPRPRHLEMMHNPNFGALAGKIRENIQIVS